MRFLDYICSGLKAFRKSDQVTAQKGSEGIGRYYTSDSQKGREDLTLLNPGYSLVIVVLIIVTFLLLVYSWQSWQLTHLKGELIDARSKVEELREERTALEYRVNSAFSLKRLELVARGELGMIEPEEVKWIKLEEEQPWKEG